MSSIKTVSCRIPLLLALGAMALWLVSACTDPVTSAVQSNTATATPVAESSKQPIIRTTPSPVPSNTPKVSPLASPTTTPTASPLVSPATTPAASTPTANPLPNNSPVVIAAKPALPWSGPSFVANGSFETSLDRWELWQDSSATASYSRTGDALSLQVQNGGSQPWSVQIYQDILDLPNGIYTLHFQARSPQNRTLGISVGAPLTAAPWFAPFMPRQTYQLSPEWRNYAYTFTKTGAISFGKLVFDAGNTGGPIAGTIELDNISLSVPWFFSTASEGGDGVAYSGFRAGQGPGWADPSDAEIIEDLEIISRNWSYIRLYSSSNYSERILQIIKERNLPIKVVLGAWIAAETSEHGNNDGASGNYANNIQAYGAILPEGVAYNQTEIANCIRLANSYPDQVVAINVANEVLVYWSTHKVPVGTIIDYVKQVKYATGLPVTVADNYHWWLSEDSRPLVEAVDFLMVHTYPMWENIEIDTAITKTVERLYGVRDKWGKPAIIGEDGWCTVADGYNGQIIATAASEKKQKIFYEQFTAWAKGEGIRTFFFEVFDEPWKGGAAANEPEKHWGLFTADRRPKLAMYELFPDLADRQPVYQSRTTIFDPAVASSNAFWNDWNPAAPSVAGNAGNSRIAGSNSAVEWWGTALEWPAETNMEPYYAGGVLVCSVRSTTVQSFLLGYQNLTYPANRDLLVRINAGDWGYRPDGNWHTLHIPIAELRAIAPDAGLYAIRSPFVVRNAEPWQTGTIEVQSVYWAK